MRPALFGWLALREWKLVCSPPASFSNDPLPIFANPGCNSGACHGAASGKKGFKISLRGYDPGTEFITLTLQPLTNPQAPGATQHHGRHVADSAFPRSTAGDAWERE